jgi:hypothetical protein
MFSKRFDQRLLPNEFYSFISELHIDHNYISSFSARNTRRQQLLRLCYNLKSLLRKHCFNMECCTFGNIVVGMRELGDGISDLRPEVILVIPEPRAYRVWRSPWRGY